MEKIESLVSSHKIPKEACYKYGTAGFRGDAKYLPAVFARLGLLCYLRAAFLEQNIGVMITASHNLHKDNGVKIIDPDGSMLEMNWEKHATKIVNFKSSKELVTFVKNLAKELKINLPLKKKIILGRDTRTHSILLGEILKQSVLSAAELFHESTNAEKLLFDYGVVTTPMLHYYIHSSNILSAIRIPKAENYFHVFAQNFVSLCQGKKGPSASVKRTLKIDCGYGVGGVCFPLLWNEILNMVGQNTMLINFVQSMQVFNTATEEEMKQKDVFDMLNNGCGAEFVQKSQSFPTGVSSLGDNEFIASFDGDADRIVYCFQKAGNFVLLDGDKISCLLSKFILNLLTEMKEFLLNFKQKTKRKLSFAVVQTAYANGASTNYIQKQLFKSIASDDLLLSNPIVRTGVKYLHEEAIKYDVSVYFEANGHGTVLFSSEFISELEQETSISAKRLFSFSKLINQTTGDAMADLLCIESVLYLQDLSYTSWSLMYTELDSKMTKVKVKDRYLIETNENETKITSHPALQKNIDQFVQESGMSLGRCFVRPSGTENVVRVYAEGESKQKIEVLIQKVEEEILKFL
eukprot:maker-scaffold_10-snap-gene-13.0-mRNA-1 protein AED:0.00 eAED:0.00 QI:39/1/1/1/1/1/2/281/576